jgi:hypothetical protein
MRRLRPALTPELQQHTNKDVARAEPYHVRTYRELMEHVARLAYLNREVLLFFRGQPRDHLNRAGRSTLYPSIYRGDPLSTPEVQARFRRLTIASRRLRDIFVRRKIDGHADLARRPLIQWSILQHYEVCHTPLLDLTHSLRVACSFAQVATKSSPVIVYVLGLPYIMNRISSNSEQEVVVVRLLSICPPSALRPYFQEGYLASTEDITSEFTDKPELDFNRRLIAKFAIPNSEAFWGPGLSRMPDNQLFPAEDSMRTLCDSMDFFADDAVAHQTVGEFIAAWTAVEQRLYGLAHALEERARNPSEALRVLLYAEIIAPQLAQEIDELRRLRNDVVHGSRRPSEAVLWQAVHQLEGIQEKLSERRKGGKK